MLKELTGFCLGPKNIGRGPQSCTIRNHALKAHWWDRADVAARLTPLPFSCSTAHPVSDVQGGGGQQVDPDKKDGVMKYEVEAHGADVR